MTPLDQPPFNIQYVSKVYFMEIFCSGSFGSIYDLSYKAIYVYFLLSGVNSKDSLVSIRDL